MPSLLDRLLGRPESTVVEAKAVLGPGAFAMLAYPPVTSLSHHPNRLISEAEALFHSNVWVGAAERAIVSRFVNAAYHLEDDQGDTLEDAASAGIRQLIDKPNPRQTRRELWSITLRHLGLTGNAFWYLDQVDQRGVPLSVLYINPARMTPVTDENGNLIGWVLDDPSNPVTGQQGRPGTPLTLDEVLQFTLDPPDWGQFGIGIAESAQAKIELARLADHHAQATLAGGGRLSGIIAPKEAANAVLSDDQWQQMVRDYRNIVSDPDSAKRLHVVRGPVDFTKTAADPTELQLVDLAKMSREDVMAAWGVPLSQIGIIGPRGLNSGEAVGFEEATIWQGAIALRSRPFLETLQYGLLDKFEGLVDANIVVDSPKFDDDTPQYDKAAVAAKIPLTVDQRLEIVGKDPLDPKVYGKLGQAIYLDQTMVRIDGLEPPPVLPPTGTPVAGAETPPTDQQSVGQTPPAKASVSDAKQRTLKRFEPKLRKAIAALLSEMRRDISDNVRERYARVTNRPKDSQAWWNQSKWEKRTADVLAPLHVELAPAAIRSARKLISSKADFTTRVQERVQTKVGQRITGITHTTRQEIQDLIEQGVADGLGPAELGDLIEGATTFDEARAEMIARTEVAQTYNDAALGTYGEYGVEEVEAIDGDDDEECADRNGQIFSVDDAESELDHPNGTLDWAPVVKAGVETSGPQQVFNIHIPDKIAAALPASVVNVSPPEVTVNVPEQPPAQVIVNVPEQQPIDVGGAVKAALAQPQQVEVVSMPQRIHKVMRNAQGQPEGSVEADA